MSVDFERNIRQAPHIIFITLTGIQLQHFRLAIEYDVGTSNVEVDSNGALQAAQPDKYADVTLKKTDNGYNLISLMAVTVGEHN